ncbi:MAG: SHOCT domain-containing protein [Microcoleus sp.]
MMRDYWGYGNNYDAWGFVFMLLMMTLVVLGVIVLVRYLGQTAHNESKEETALDLLKNRYAKGEIDKKEFEEKRKDLSA